MAFATFVLSLKSLAIRSATVGFLVGLAMLAVAATGCVPTTAASEEGQVNGAAIPSAAQTDPQVPQYSKAERNAADKPATDVKTDPKANPKADAAKENTAKAGEPMPDDEFPFPNRVKSPSLDGGVGWINTPGPIDIKDLKGKFVVLDFWTYCCINCMHVLPELKKLEKAYPKNVVVIGVHSAKFQTEKDTKNITDAVMRYEIEHPVVNDANMVLFRKFAASGWPAIRIIDPEGYFIGGEGGEVPFEAFDAFFKKVIPVYRKRGSLDETPLHFDLEAKKAATTPLRFPGKVLADEASKRLFVADSNHNRIVVADLAGKLLATIGSGEIGKADGDFATATFDHPQGMALLGETLYVADTENHLLRKVDLKTKRVTTIAGTGVQSRNPWPGLEKMDRSLLGEPEYPARWVGKPRETPISSPWDVLVHGKDLYIAMAGPHQIWKMPLDESEIGPFAGNGREDIVDGPLLPQRPYAQGFASFAQPSGLSTDGTWLFVADSEGSSIRAVPFDPKKEVETIVGTAHLEDGRLFEFGDQDGENNNVKLQHALGVVFVDGLLYVADTYNSKIKVVDRKKRSAKTIAGGPAEKPDAPAAFDEPAGISYAAGKLYVADTNAHAIRTVNLRDGNKVASLVIDGLKPPTPAKTPIKPSFAGATVIKLDPIAVKPAKNADGKDVVKLAVKLQLPALWKTNAQATTSYYIEATKPSGPIDRAALGNVVTLDKPSAEFEIALPLAKTTGEESLKVLVIHYYCQEGEGGLCKVASLVFETPVKLSGDAKVTTVEVKHELN